MDRLYRGREIGIDILLIGNNGLMGCQIGIRGRIWLTLPVEEEIKG